jgi:hypothetical protein
MYKKAFALLAVATTIAFLTPMTALAHDGRRFELQIHNDKIYAQGYLSGDKPNDDGGGIIRPYVNSMHSHWSNNIVPVVNSASGTLPGFDLFESTPLDGHELTITLNASSKWVNPPITPLPGTVPDLVPLEAGDKIVISRGNPRTNTDFPGSFVLQDVVAIGGTTDMDPLYEIEQRPAGVIHVLEFVISTDAPGIAASDPIFVLLSPAGDNPIDRLHLASLYLEEYLGTQVPAPGAMAVLGMGALIATRRKR